jgi:uncharacterized membrane protein YjjP (DUF1212 family)
MGSPMTEEQESVDFIVELGTALHRYGTPAHRLEAALSSMAQILDLEAQILSTPTSIMVGFGTPGAQRTALIRVDPGAHNLEKLAAVDDLAERVARRELSLEAAIAELHELNAAPNLVGPIWTTLAFPVVSAASATFLGGAAQDLAVAAASGLAIGLLALFIPRTTAGGRIFELLAATLAGAAAHSSAALPWQVSYDIVLLAGLITLVPGLALTVGMTEIATRNLVSGNARLTASGVVFLEIIFGVALAEQLFTNLLGAPPMLTSEGLPGWAFAPALAGACLGVAALFKAHPRSFPIIAFTSIAAFYSARLGAAHLSAELGACVGGFVATAIANTYARLGNRSAMVPLVPGLLLLVPGSLGFRSLSSLWEQDVVGGIDGAFKMVLVAISLVAGILVANAVVLPRRSL